MSNLTKTSAERSNGKDLSGVVSGIDVSHSLFSLRAARGNTLSGTVVPVVRRAEKDRYRACRAALQHLGFLCLDDNGRGGPLFCLLENSDKLKRSIAQLDKTTR